MFDWFAYLAVGTLVGTLAGLLGIGGGIVVVVVLAHMFSVQGISNELSIHLAVGTSQATIVMTALVAMWAHHRRQGVLWSVMAAMAPGIIIGALIGALIADTLSGEALKGVFGGVAVLIAWQMGSALSWEASYPLPRRWLLALVGAGIGTVSALVGIGGGSLTVPYLAWHNISVRRAVGTASACSFPLAVGGTGGFILLGWNEPGLPLGSSGYVYWPAAFGIVMASTFFAPIGVKLAYQLASLTLKRIFAFFLGGLGISMLLEVMGRWVFLS